MQWMRLMLICCGMPMEGMEMLGVNVNEDEDSDYEYGDSDSDY